MQLFEQISLTVICAMIGVCTWLFVKLNHYKTLRANFQYFTGDSVTHIKIIDALRKYGRAKLRIDQFVILNRFAYPVMFHEFVRRFFSKSRVHRNPFLPNIILQFLAFALFIGLCFAIGDRPPLSSLEWVSMCSLFFVLRVSEWRLDQDNFHYIFLTPRFLVKLFTGFAVAIMVLYESDREMTTMVVGVLASTGTMLSSKFGRQVLVFFAPIYSLLVLSFSPLIMLLGGMVMSMLLTKFRIVKSFIHTWKYSLVIYKKYIKPFNATNMSHFLSGNDLRKQFAGMRWRELIVHLIVHEPMRLLVKFPELVVVVTAILLFGQEMQMSIPILILIAIAYWTSLKRFSHLGEGFRYVEYGGYFLIPLMASSVLAKTEGEIQLVVTALTLMAGLISLFIQGKLIQRVSFSNSTREVDFFNSLQLSSKDTVFSMSFHTAAQIAMHSEARTFRWQPGGIVEEAKYKEYFEDYPLLSFQWAHLFKKHNVTHVIEHKSIFEKYKKAYNFENIVQIAEDDQMIAFQYQKPLDL